MTQLWPSMHIQVHSVSRWKHSFSKARFHSGPNSSNLEKLDIFRKAASLLFCQHSSSLELWAWECFLGQKEPPWLCWFLPTLHSTRGCCSEAGAAPRACQAVLFAINYSPLEKCEQSRWVLQGWTVFSPAATALPASCISAAFALPLSVSALLRLQSWRSWD